MSRGSRFRLIVMCCCVSLLWAGGACAGFLHGEPDFDSGWIETTPSTEIVVAHHLGGDVSDYVVSMEFMDADELGYDNKEHTFFFGGDMWDVRYGIAWTNLTDSQVTVRCYANVDTASRARIRIWIAPSPDYETAWLAIQPGGTLTIYHTLGGVPDDYVVDLQFLADSFYGVHQLGYGGDRFRSAGNLRSTGAYWDNLGASSIEVHRGADDTEVDSVRVRLWRAPGADYDSGWVSTTFGFYRLHQLGGPWNDFVTDVQFRDIGDGHGVNHYAFGGDAYDDGSRTGRVEGALWTELTGRQVRAYRQVSDTAADQMRIRLWSSRAPKWDSGWIPITPGGSGMTVEHWLEPAGALWNIDELQLFVDLQFKDTAADGTSGLGVNHKGYGLDVWSSTGQSSDGAAWSLLGPSTINIYRTGDITGADLARARIWQAPRPSYDSGWVPVDTNETVELTHNLGGDPEDYVVDLTYRRDAASATGQVFLGGDIVTESSGLTFRGFNWYGLTSSGITVHNLADTVFYREGRVRIWVTPPFDATSDWLEVLGSTPFAHDLGGASDDLVVDFQCDGEDTFHRLHNLQYGGDRWNGGAVHQGAWWEQLTSSEVTLMRGANDSTCSKSRVRIWRTGVASALIFADGFESGDTTAW